uniref:TraA n=1 Tax=Aetherobacter sp. TaxID=2022431 RepID=A0A410RAC7_9BACT|nr:TraA [Aetherobacter sp.]
MLSKRIGIALAGLLALLPMKARAAETVVGLPVALPLTVDGTGLCIASAVSQNVLADFDGLNTFNYNGRLNTFIEAHALDRIESVVHTLLDLSNNNDSGAQVKPSYGDFTSVMTPLCKIGGCDFIVNDTTTSFGSRLRGFLNVTDDMVNKPIHIGLFADDAVSITFFGKGGTTYPVTIRPPQLGAPTWRVTNTVKFQSAGLYPVEILYVEIVEHAALEVSYFIGDFADFERPANQAPVTKLNDLGFQLFPPKSFSMTVSGQIPYPDPDVCKQCDRQFVNLPGNNGCKLGYYCNEAALCSPCDSAALCGATCSPCGGATPFCINTNGTLDCGSCRSDLDCQSGYTCDLVTHECHQTHECEDDSQCDQGKSCTNYTCQWCDTPDHCAGNSCNCCPRGNNAKETQCRPLGATDGAPVCVECVTTADCASGVCDQLSGLCVDALAQNERPDCCGENCVACPTDAPFCLPTHLGEVCAVCRNDLDCKSGDYCLSGQCRACIEDRRCGPRCETCNGDTPFCLGSQISDTAVCVRCTSDAQCPGSSCDPTTHACVPPCSVSCGPTTPYCFDNACVECYADTQCPCGGTCIESTHRCDTACDGNQDCSGNEHCRWAETATYKECTPGPMLDNTGCGSTLGSACTGSTIGSKGVDPVPPSGVAALSVLAFLVRRQRMKRKARLSAEGGGLS